jgi:hypothetical protein
LFFESEFLDSKSKVSLVSIRLRNQKILHFFSISVERNVPSNENTPKDRARGTSPCGSALLEGDLDMVCSRRAFLKRVGAGALAATAVLHTTGQGAASRLAGTRPNIILIMTDDQGKGDLSCLGNTVLKTPHLDRLHSLSTRFTDFHVSPTCAPTRSAIMSGRHEFKNGVTHTILERERMALSTTTIAQVLQKDGYSTGIFGKWHLGDEKPYQPHNRGFDEVFIHGAGGIGQAYACSCADAPPNQENRYFDCVIRHNTKFVKTKGFCTDEIVLVKKLFAGTTL